MKQLSLFTEEQLKQPTKEEEIKRLKEYIRYLRLVIIEHAKKKLNNE